jgi:hypothetical protein
MDTFDRTPIPRSPRIVTVTGGYDPCGVAIGTRDAAVAWESDPDEEGAFVHLARTADGRFWLSVADREEHDSSYVSVPITEDDLTRLAIRLQLLRLTP